MFSIFENLFIKKIKIIFAALIFIPIICFADSDNYSVGVFYFPGWKDNQTYAPSPRPWTPIKSYPERRPLLGWYDEGDDTVMRQQIDWMKSSGMSFVAFDWYYGEHKKVYLEHALAAFMRASNRGALKFTLLWANHSSIPAGHDDWASMVRYWARYYFPRDDYLKIEGKPVVFIFSADELKKNAEKFGSSSKELLSIAQTIAQENGVPGIYFVAGTGAYAPMISAYAKDSGYSAFSAYNYHQGPTDAKQSHSYQELDQGYRQHWLKFAQNGNLPLIVPMTSGWAKQPWGGSKDAEHDKSLSTPGEFKQHLQAARQFMEKNPQATNRMGVICCWNEYGEGSFIEPAELAGIKYLESVKDVFSTR